MLLTYLILIFIFGLGFGMYLVSLITNRGDKGRVIGWMAFYVIGSIWFVYCIFNMVNG